MLCILKYSYLKCLPRLTNETYTYLYYIHSVTLKIHVPIMFSNHSPTSNKEVTHAYVFSSKSALFSKKKKKKKKVKIVNLTFFTKLHAISYLT